MPRRRRRFWKILLAVFVALLALLVWAAWPGRQTFTVGPETTYITAPLDEHGYPDYVTGLNERLRGDIVPERNANVLIWQALGPRPEGGAMPAEYWKWLGTDPPPEQGEYFVSSWAELKERLNIQTDEQRKGFYDQIAACGKRPWAGSEAPQLAQWLKINEKPLAMAIEAGRRPDYYNPLVPPRTPGLRAMLSDALLPNVQKCRELASALRCRAMLRVKEGKSHEAWQDLLTCHRLGRLVARGGTLVEWLVGVAIERGAAETDLALLEHGNLGSRQIAECSHDLHSLPAMPRVADKIDQCERLMFLELLTAAAWCEENGLSEDSLSTRKPTRKGAAARVFTRSINWDRAMRHANRHYDRAVEAVRLPEYSARKTEMAQIDTEINIRVSETGQQSLAAQLGASPAARGERIGNVMLGLQFPALEKVWINEDRSEQTQRNLRLAFALAAYRSDHGRYPAALDDLAPKYIDKVPTDLFSDGPLVYQLEGKGYLLYSVGPNETDEEGRGPDDTPRGDDIAVRMPVPEPAKKE